MIDIETYALAKQYTDEEISHLPSSDTYTKEEIDEKFQEIDLEDYVKDTDIAGANKLGLISSGAIYGFTVNANGVPYANKLSYEQASTRSDTLFISKGTMMNFLDALVIPQTETVVPFNFGIDLNLNNNKIYVVEETVENFSAAYNITNASQSCEVILTASANGINLSGLEGTPYFYGADCTDGVFTATPSTKYDILFTHDGTRNIAIVMKL